jgi:3-oxoacyl-[acyl-carrier-protein] synthase-3
MSFEIENISYEIGEKTLEIKDYCQSRNKDYSRLIQKTGFEQTHHTSKSYQDFFGGFLTNKLNLKSNDGIILVNQSAQEIIPGILPKLFLNLPNIESITTFQISDGCSGFVKALILADSLLSSANFNRIHIICAEKYSDYFHEDNESLMPIFSDAISVTTLRKGAHYRITSLDTINNFIDYRKISVDASTSLLSMEGSNVYGWVTANTVPQIERVLLENDISTKDVKSWQIHQASQVMVGGILERLKIEGEFIFNSSKVGNTVSSSIPISIQNSFGTSNDLSQNGYHVLSGFGVGLTSVVAVLEASR